MDTIHEYEHFMDGYHRGQEAQHHTLVIALVTAFVVGIIIGLLRQYRNGDK